MNDIGQCRREDRPYSQYHRERQQNRIVTPGDTRRRKLADSWPGEHRFYDDAAFHEMWDV